MSIPTHILESVSNNSAVVVTRSEAAISILCHSPLKGTDAALWIAPSGSIVPAMNANRSNSFLLVHTFANLSLVDSIVASENGVYTCAVSDENRELQMLHVGVFNSSHCESHNNIVTTLWSTLPSIFAFYVGTFFSSTTCMAPCSSYV